MQTKKTVNLIDIVSPELVEFVAMVSLGIIDFNALGRRSSGFSSEALGRMLMECRPVRC